MHFGADRDLVAITPGDADAWRLCLVGLELSAATVNRGCGVAKQFFMVRLRRRLIPAGHPEPPPAVRPHPRQGRRQALAAAVSELAVHPGAGACPDLSAARGDGLAGEDPEGGTAALFSSPGRGFWAGGPGSDRAERSAQNSAQQPAAMAGLGSHMPSEGDGANRVLRGKTKEAELMQTLADRTLGQGRIRTYVDLRQWVYSPSPLATRAPAQTLIE
jgi:hypothetical protein